MQEVQREHGLPARNYIVFVCFKLWTVG